VKIPQWELVTINYRLATKNEKLTSDTFVCNTRTANNKKIINPYGQRQQKI
jgi:hypothetical protein